LRLRDGLVVGQLRWPLHWSWAGLMIQTIWNLRKQPLGFRADHLLTMAVPIPRTKYDTSEKTRRFSGTLRKKRARCPE